jgi:hypothetical protein
LFCFLTGCCSFCGLFDAAVATKTRAPSNRSARSAGTMVPPPSTALPPTGKIVFPGPIGTKRRRMRSGGGVSTLANQNNGTSKGQAYPSNNNSSSAVMPSSSPVEEDEDFDLNEMDEEKMAQTSNCKGTSTIPIFLKSEYFGSSRWFRSFQNLISHSATPLIAFLDRNIQDD